MNPNAYAVGAGIHAFFIVFLAALLIFGALNLLGISLRDIGRVLRRRRRSKSA